MQRSGGGRNGLDRAVQAHRQQFHAQIRMARGQCSRQLAELLGVEAGFGLLVPFFSCSNSPPDPLPSLLVVEG